MRKYINLVEATLYRGDASEIEAFDTNKTYENALFGRGIYLTDKHEVASDYTVNKGATDQMISNPRVEYTSKRGAVIGVIMDIMNKELNWKETRDAIKSEHSARWWDDAIPGHPGTRAMRYGDPGHEAARDQQQTDYNADLLAEYSKALRKAKQLYKARSVDYRIVKDTMGRWMVVKANRSGRVSRFDIPDDYLANTLHGDEPMTDAEIKIVGQFIEHASPAGTDLRDRDNQMVRTDDGTHNFWKWVEIFKKHGSEYAWREGKHRAIGGKGLNPTLDEVWNGQHGGFHIFYKSGGEFITYMKSHGYNGIQYNGGVRIGDHVRGGGGILHTSYVLWDSDYVNQCRVDQEAMSDDPIDYDTKKLLAKSLYNRHRSSDGY